MIRDLLFDTDPYRDFKKSNMYRKDSVVSGWNYERDYFKKIIKDVAPIKILEVGTWLGGSAIRMAKEAIKYKQNVEIVCIDTFLGDAMFWEKHDKSRDLKKQFGFPSVYYEFLSNVCKEGLENVITPFPISSCCGLKFLIKHSIKFDLSYIDASHEYEDVINDIRLAKKISPIIFGDDYYSFADVGRAVDEMGGKPQDDWFWKIDVQ